MKNETLYITAHGKARLERDLLELETVKLASLVELVPEAAQGGDSGEANPSAGMIGNVFPLGKLLLGKHADDNVCVETRLETTHFRLVKIQPTKGKYHYATV